MTAPGEAVAVLGELRTEIADLQQELASIEAAISARRAEAILQAETPAADASLALVRRCLDDVVASARAEARSAIEEPAEWAAAERLRAARRRADAVRTGEPDGEETFEDFWREQDHAVGGRRRALARIAPIGAAIPVAALLVGAAALLHLV